MFVVVSPHAPSVLTYMELHIHKKQQQMTLMAGMMLDDAGMMLGIPLMAGMMLGIPQGLSVISNKLDLRLTCLKVTCRKYASNLLV